MIQSNQHSICIVLGNGEKLPLLADAVAKMLYEQDRFATVIEPWQVEEMANALIYYLRTDQKCDDITQDDFLGALSKLAGLCGYPVGGTGLVSADLFEIALKSGGGFELAFFQSVERAIQRFRQGRARWVSFVRLQSCVRLLIGAKNWGKSCQRLNDDIVEFIRSRMLQGPLDVPVVFSVSQSKRYG